MVPPRRLAHCESLTLGSASHPWCARRGAELLQAAQSPFPTRFVAWDIVFIVLAARFFRAGNLRSGEPFSWRRLATGW
jgi:hypothetical protein